MPTPGCWTPCGATGEDGAMASGFPVARRRHRARPAEPGDLRLRLPHGGPDAGQPRLRALDHHRRGPAGRRAAGDTEQERFAAYERVVMAHEPAACRRRPAQPAVAASARAPHRGARGELEYGAARHGHGLRARLLRLHRRAEPCGTAHARLVDVVADGEPALLYIGNACCRATSPSSCPVTATACWTSTTRPPARSRLLDETRFVAASCASRAGTCRG